MRRLALLLALAMAACSSEPAPPSSATSTAERGAVHYHQVGGTALACRTWGFDTVCRSP
jgi:hypothetical protein